VFSAIVLLSLRIIYILRYDSSDLSENKCLLVNITYVCMNVYMYVCVNVCVYVRLYVCMYVCMYILTYSMVQSPS